MKGLCEFCSEEFSGYYTDYGYSVNKVSTLDEYTNYVNLLCNHLCKDFLEINEEEARGYIEYLMGRCAYGKLSRKTVCVRLSCYKAIGRYVELVKDGYISPFEHVRRPDKSDDRINPKRIPSLSELDKFMSEVKSDPMYFLIYALATRVGLSATVILQIKTGDIMFEDISHGDIRRTVALLRLPAKGLSDDRYVTLPSDVTEILRSYLKVVTPVNDRIFVNQHNRPMTIKNLDSATERFVKKCGIERYTMKDFRNRAILELAKSGADLESIGEYTGLSRMRVNTIVSSKGILGKCPADLVNYQLKTS